MQFFLKNLPGIILTLMLFSSCSNNKTDLMRQHLLNATLIQNADNTKQQTKLLYISIQQKMGAPETSEKAIIWNARAAAVQKTTDNMIEYIDTLKKGLMEKAGIENTDCKILYKEEKKSAVYDMLIKKEKGIDLYDHLKKYQSILLNIDPEIRNEFGLLLEDISKFGDDTATNKRDFLNVCFKNISLSECLVVLSNFQSTLRRNENQIVTFCHNHIGPIGNCGYRSEPVVLVSQNSSIVKAGDPIIVTAGIGTFEIQMSPSFAFEGKHVPLSNDNTATYKINTHKKAGHYTLPVSVEYTDPNGEKDSRKTEVKYEVITDSTVEKQE